MALKDLVVSNAVFSEEIIEDLIARYARYDPDANRVILLPDATALSHRQRIAVYLVALAGWSFLVPEGGPPTSAKPAEIEAALNIAGGTVRPILKEFKDSRMVQVADGRYSVNPATVTHLREVIEGQAVPRTRPRRSRAQAAPASQPSPKSTLTSVPNGKQQDEDDLKDTEKREAGGKKKRSRRDATVAGMGPLQRVRKLIAEGWFSKPRPVREIVHELAARGATYRGQDLTRQMQDLTKSGELRREKRALPGGGRPVWHYTSIVE